MGPKREKSARARGCPVSIVDMACLLCGGTALGARGATAEIELRCGICGLYSITVGAVNVLRQSPEKTALVRAEVDRRRADGDATPRVDMDLVDAALAAPGRPGSPSTA